jgi:hypothetical protein
MRIELSLTGAAEVVIVGLIRFGQHQACAEMGRIETQGRLEFPPRLGFPAFAQVSHADQPTPRMHDGCSSDAPYYRQINGAHVGQAFQPDLSVLSGWKA